jgi:hypothetical protein
LISTREKQQLPTPHRHHSQPEMDSMLGRSTRHQPSSLLLGLPQDLRIEIVVGATSERPLAAAISRVQEPAAAAVWKKDGFEFLCFAAETVSCAAKW